MPYAACSAGAPPMPIPRMSRPPLATCSVEAIRATRAGWRFMTLSTNGATVTRLVRAAAMDSIVHASTTGTVLSPRPMKWSQHQIPA